MFYRSIIGSSRSIIETLGAQLTTLETMKVRDKVVAVLNWWPVLLTYNDGDMMIVISDACTINVL
jgi:hypothetical protein